MVRDDTNYIWCVFLVVHNLLSLNWNSLVRLNIYTTKIKDLGMDKDVHRDIFTACVVSTAVFST